MEEAAAVMFEALSDSTMLLNNRARIGRKCERKDEGTKQTEPATLVRERRSEAP